MGKTYKDMPYKVKLNKMKSGVKETVWNHFHSGYTFEIDPFIYPADRYEDALAKVESLRENKRYSDWSITITEKKGYGISGCPDKVRTGVYSRKELDEIRAENSGLNYCGLSKIGGLDEILKHAKWDIWHVVEATKERTPGVTTEIELDPIDPKIYGGSWHISSNCRLCSQLEKANYKKEKRKGVSKKDLKKAVKEINHTNGKIPEYL